MHHALYTRIALHSHWVTQWESRGMDTHWAGNTGTPQSGVKGLAEGAAGGLLLQFPSRRDLLITYSALFTHCKTFCELSRIKNILIVELKLSSTSESLLKQRCRVVTFRYKLYYTNTPIYTFYSKMKQLKAPWHAVTVSEAFWIYVKEAERTIPQRIDSTSLSSIIISHLSLFFPTVSPLLSCSLPTLKRESWQRPTCIAVTL